ncbi:MAG TPA: fatty acid desaturase [Verrucomicrobiae bacterium]|nr:fatty acid desaturase [Verrucomicrobiae bacterium]
MDSIRILAQPRRAGQEITAGIETEIEELHALDARKRAREFGFFVALYAFGAFLAAQSQIGWPSAALGIVVMGLALNSCGIFIHDGLHGLLAGNARANHALSLLVGLPILMSPTAYEITHQNHHYALGRKLDYGTYRQHARTPAFVWAAYLFQLFFGSLLYVLLIPFLAFRSGSTREKTTIVIEYLVVIAIYAVAITNISTDLLLRFWLLPLLVMTVLTNIRGLASHALGDVEDIYLSSRTVRSSRFVAFLFLYENYHLEHHIFPRVPSYNLAAVHALIWDRLPYAVYARSYMSFLVNFFKAACKRDLRPLGVVTPRNCA